MIKDIFVPSHLLQNVMQGEWRYDSIYS